jgi:hypothetical protein
MANLYGKGRRLTPLQYAAQLCRRLATHAAGGRCDWDDPVVVAAVAQALREAEQRGMKRGRRAAELVRRPKGE